MNTFEIKRAAALISERERAIGNLKAMEDYEVFGVELRRGLMADSVHIGSGGGSGTGTITSIGWSDDLQAAVTAAFRKVFQDRIDAATVALTVLNVEVP